MQIRRTRATRGTAQSIAIAGGVGRALDEVTQKPIFIDFVHHEVHDGNTFQTCQKSADGSPIADNASYDMLLITGNEAEPHLVFNGAAGGTSEVILYKGTTVSNNGALIATQNMRQSLHGIKLNTLLAYTSPTVTGAGTQMHIQLLPGGSGPGQSTSGGTVRQETEWVLAVNTNYMIRVTNRSGNAQPASILAQWYEKIPEDQ